MEWPLCARRGSRSRCRVRLKLFRKLRSQLIQLICPQTHCLLREPLGLLRGTSRIFGGAGRLALIGFFLEPLTQKRRGSGAMFFGDRFRRLSVERETIAGLLDRLQVPQGIGMLTECDAQGFAMQFGLPFQHLLVDADRQWEAITKRRIIPLQFFKECPGGLHGGGGRSGRVHSGKTGVAGEKRSPRIARHVTLLRFAGQCAPPASIGMLERIGFVIQTKAISPRNATEEIQKMSVAAIVLA